MKRRVFNTLVVVSLLLSLATVALWIRSYRVGDFWLRNDGRGGVLMLLSNCGYLSVWKVAGNSGKLVYFDRYEVPPTLWADSRFARFELGWDGFAFPYWAPCAFLAVQAVCLWRLRGQRFPNGSCANCGYDLRATPERCPECGAVPKNAGARG